MRLTEMQKEYWRRNVRMTTLLLLLWFAVAFFGSYFAPQLNRIVVFDFPLGFYIGAQGALVVFVLIVFFYAIYMNRLDKEYGVQEADEEQ